MFHHVTDEQWFSYVTVRGQYDIDYWLQNLLPSIHSPLLTALLYCNTNKKKLNRPPLSALVQLSCVRGPGGKDQEKGMDQLLLHNPVGSQFSPSVLFACADGRVCGTWGEAWAGRKDGFGACCLVLRLQRVPGITGGFGGGGELGSVSFQLLPLYWLVSLRGQGRRVWVNLFSPSPYRLERLEIRQGFWGAERVNSCLLVLGEEVQG